MPMHATQPKTIKPRRLKLGDTIGIVAPASPFDAKELEQGRAVLHAMGYSTRPAEGLFARQGYLAGDDTQRVAQLHQMFADDRVQAIMCARGGYGCLRLLADLDFDLIGTQAKPLVGFSDITALHQAVFSRTGLVTFHGPLVTSMATADAATQRAWQLALSSEQPLRIAAQRPLVIKPGVAQAVVAGGNLTTLGHLLGTRFAPVFKDQLLLIEDTGEAPYRIDRILTQMHLAGCFAGLAGLIVGSFKNCGSEAEIVQVVAQRFENLNIPILAGFSMGHAGRNLTIPLGITARLDTERGDLVFLETATGD